jgi:hypothetical protein
MFGLSQSSKYDGTLGASFLKPDLAEKKVESISRIKNKKILGSIRSAFVT